MLAYNNSRYGEFSVGNLTRKIRPAKREWNSFSVTPLTDEKSKELQRGIHGDGAKKFYKFD
ncbi:MAG: hypothetical protein MR957_06305 [Lachnobacterium sp.]|nr:hypothetical protein [uncultured Agathobacter sp.]MCI7113239.1 hypothetical protein [Lachnobacterium sp.]